MRNTILFFNNQTIYEIDWSSQLKIRIGPVSSSSKNQISRSLKDLSTESIRNRFMGPKKEFSPEELKHFTELDGWNHYAIGIEEKENLRRGIGIARLVRSNAVHEEAEVAITIIDEYQGLGLGSLLIKIITLAATEREIRKLIFTTLPQNSSLLKLIQKIGTPVIVSTARDFLVLSLDLRLVDLEDLKAQLVPILPEIGTFDLKT